MRRGRGAVRSVLVKLSRLRVPRANCTVKRSPMKSEPWKAMSKISNCVEPGKLGSYAAIPGTTSRASIASLYSMNPKPFMSLISVISPVPWVLKWASTSALVAVDGCQSGLRRRTCAKPRTLSRRCYLPLRGRLPRYNLVDDTSAMARS